MFSCCYFLSVKIFPCEFSFHVRLSLNKLLAVQIMSLLMKQNFNSIKDLRGCTYQLVLARLYHFLFLFWCLDVTLPFFFYILKFCNLLCFSLFFFPNKQHYQRDIVRGVEGYIVTGSKQVEIGKKSKRCCHFGILFMLIL